MVLELEKQELIYIEGVNVLNCPNSKEWFTSWTTFLHVKKRSWLVSAKGWLILGNNLNFIWNFTMTIMKITMIRILKTIEQHLDDSAPIESKDIEEQIDV